MAHRIYRDKVHRKFVEDFLETKKEKNQFIYITSIILGFAYCKLAAVLELAARQPRVLLPDTSGNTHSSLLKILPVIFCDPNFSRRLTIVIT